VELGGRSVAAGGSNITFDFANTGPAALNTGVIQFDNVSFAGGVPLLTQRITDVAGGDELVIPGADLTGDTVTLSAGLQLAVVSPTNAVVLAMGPISLEPGETNAFAIVNGNTIQAVAAPPPPTTRTWLRAESGSWKVGSNWAGAVPGKNDAVAINVIGAGSPYTVTYDQPSTANNDIIGDLEVNASNATLNFAASDTLTVIPTSPQHLGLTDLKAGTIEIAEPAALLSTRVLTSSSGTVIDVGNGGSLTVGAGDAAIDGTLESTSGTGTVIGTLDGAGVVEAAGATLDLVSDIASSSLAFEVSDDAASVLRLDGAVADDKTFTFLGPAGQIEFNNDATVTVNVIGQNVGSSAAADTNFVSLLGDYAVSGDNAFTGTAGTVILTDGALTDTLTLSGVTNAGTKPWFVNTVVSGGTTEVFLSNVVCYASGTRIATPAGERTVEDLQIGDLVVTAEGATKPIKWIGRRRINLSAHSRPETVAPVRIQRGAFADNMPHADLAKHI
jgi:hypothetical protein